MWFHRFYKFQQTIHAKSVIRKLKEMEGDYICSNLNPENELQSLKKTVYRLTVNMDSQKRDFEAEVLILKTAVETQRNIAEHNEKTVDSLQGKVNNLNGQVSSRIPNITAALFVARLFTLLR